LKELNPALFAASVQPDSPLHGLEGVKHLGTATIPGIYDPSLVQKQIEISTEEALEMARRLAHEEGLSVGASSGANVVAALSLAQTVPSGSLIVTILCDRGERYLE